MNDQIRMTKGKTGPDMRKARTTKNQTTDSKKQSRKPSFGGFVRPCALIGPLVFVSGALLFVLSLGANPNSELFWPKKALAQEPSFQNLITNQIKGQAVQQGAAFGKQLAGQAFSKAPPSVQSAIDSVRSGAQSLTSAGDKLAGNLGLPSGTTTQALTAAVNGNLSDSATAAALNLARTKGTQVAGQLFQTASFNPGLATQAIGAFQNGFDDPAQLALNVAANQFGNEGATGFALNTLGSLNNGTLVPDLAQQGLGLVSANLGQYGDQVAAVAGGALQIAQGGKGEIANAALGFLGDKLGGAGGVATEKVLNFAGDTLSLSTFEGIGGETIGNLYEGVKNGLPLDRAEAVFKQMVPVDGLVSKIPGLSNLPGGMGALTGDAAGIVSAAMANGPLSPEAAGAVLSSDAFSGVMSNLQGATGLGAGQMAAYAGNVYSLLSGEVDAKAVATMVASQLPYLGTALQIYDMFQNFDIQFAIQGGLTALAMSQIGLISLPAVVSVPGFAGGCCGCTAMAMGQYFTTKSTIEGQFQAQRSWLNNTFFRQHVLRAMMEMAQQLTVMAVQKTQMIGSFIDAKHQLETQRLFQQLQAQAHKDYHPSEGLCEIGTNTRSLAASEKIAEFSALAISGRSMQRQLVTGAVLSVAPESASDKNSRLEKFMFEYCDPSDNGNGLAELCAGNIPGEQRNRDIDFTRTLETPLTLEIDYVEGSQPSRDEQDIFALGANLYAHDIPAFMGNIEEEKEQYKYLDLRSVIAKRSVAQNSFAAIAAMKARGAPGTGQYMSAILQEVGLPPGEISGILGQNPSYFAQMEVLTKKLYQSPNFYTNLYDKPANVARKGAALQAIGLMQDRDIYRSLLRSEAVLSVLLETELMRRQRALRIADGNEGG